MSELEKKLGYTFRDPELLALALTHSSWSNERGLGHKGCNERLEFLGDSILGFVVAEALFQTYGDKPEGEMTRLRAELVCEASLWNLLLPWAWGSSCASARGKPWAGAISAPA